MSTIELIGVGIDTARYGHHVSFLDDQKRTASKPFHFAESASGYQILVNTIQRLQKKHPQAELHFRIDAAGQYATNLIAFLDTTFQKATLSVGQPTKNENYRKAHFNKRKADPVESLACARFAVVEKPSPTEVTDPAFRVLRDAVAQMEASATARTRLVNQFHNLMSRSFPELATIVSDLGSPSIVKMIEKYPTAQRMAAARLSTLKDLPHIEHALAEKIHQAAKTSIASETGSTVESIIRRKAKAILREREEHRELGEIVDGATEDLPPGPHQRIATIPGIGRQTRAALLAKIVSIDRFATAKSLIGYFGVFPEEVDVSGTNKDGTPKAGRVFRMSRKGNDLVRRLLFTAAQCAVKHNPPVKALFARLRASGKDYNTAIGHCMAKLLRQVFAVWKRDSDFDPEYEIAAEQSSEAESADVDTDKQQDRDHQGSEAVIERVTDMHVEPTASPTGEKKKIAAGHSQASKPSSKVVTATAEIIATTLPSNKRSPRRSTGKKRSGSDRLGSTPQKPIDVIPNQRKS